MKSNFWNYSEDISDGWNYNIVWSYIYGYIFKQTNVRYVHMKQYVRL